MFCRTKAASLYFSKFSRKRQQPFFKIAREGGFFAKTQDVYSPIATMPCESITPGKTCHAKVFQADLLLRRCAHHQRGPFSVYAAPRHQVQRHAHAHNTARAQLAQHREIRTHKKKEKKRKPLGDVFRRTDPNTPDRALSSFFELSFGPGA